METVCSSCGSEVADGSAACPSGGAMSATGNLGQTGSGTLDVVVVEVGYSEQESWLSKWDDVIRDYEAVENGFTTAGTDNRIIRHRLLRFFEDC